MMSQIPVFTYAEAIELILGFYTFTLGYWEDELDEYPLVKRCIELGYAIRDNEHEDKYILSNKGQEFFHAYIKSISEQLISEVKKQNYEATFDGIEKWFRKEFQLENENDSKEIAEYIILNLNRYGFKVIKGFSQSKGSFCQFMEC